MIKENNKLDCGVEVLRIILMVFIVSHHCIVHGIGFSDLQSGEWIGNNTEVYAFCNAFLVVAVNVFFMISEKTDKKDFQ